MVQKRFEAMGNRDAKFECYRGTGNGESERNPGLHMAAGTAV